MTAKEADRLEPGMRVLAFIAGTWEPVEVVEVNRFDEDDINWLRYSALAGRNGENPLPAVGDVGSVTVRLPGRQANGRINRAACKSLSQIRALPDPVAANVYADWLEEHDFGEAANALRTAFPLADGKPDSAVVRT